MEPFEILDEAAYWDAKYSFEEEYFLILLGMSKKNTQVDDVTPGLHCWLRALWL